MRFGASKYMHMRTHATLVLMFVYVASGRHKEVEIQKPHNVLFADAIYEGSQLACQLQATAKQ